MRGVEYRDDRNRWARARLARSAIEGQRQRTELPFADPAYGVHAYYRLRDSTPGRSQRCDGGDATSRVCRTAMARVSRNLRREAVRSQCLPYRKEKAAQLRLLHEEGFDTDFEPWTKGLLPRNAASLVKSGVA